MYHWWILSYIVLLTYFVNAVGVSPKLDFGGSNPLSVNAGIRKNVELSEGNLNYRVVQPHQKRENIEILCTSGNCNTTTNEKHNGLSTDVLVHVRTNVDVGSAKNETVTSTPDIPIIIGSKTGTIAPNRALNEPNAVFYSPYHPTLNIIPPLSDDNNNLFSPNNFVQNTDQMIRRHPIITNYAPSIEKQHNNNINNVKSFGNNNPHLNNYAPWPQTFSHGRGNIGGSQNPLEFRKTYNIDNWSPIKWTANNYERRSLSSIPTWTPCVCPNQYPATPGYFQANNSPSGINGKMAALV